MENLERLVAAMPWSAHLRKDWWINMELEADPQLDDILVAALYSINSSTYSYGRCPYQAVFGRLPRPVGDLISDHHALSTTNRDHDPAPRPELLRAEAVTALMQISSSQAVRRTQTRNPAGSRLERHQFESVFLNFELLLVGKIGRPAKRMSSFCVMPRRAWPKDYGWMRQDNIPPKKKL